MTSKNFFSRVLTPLLIIATMVFAGGCENNPDNSNSSANVQDKSVPTSEEKKTVQSLEIDRCTKEIGRNPNDIDAYLERAQHYWKLNQYELAVKNYDKIIELASDCSYAYMGCGASYLKMKNYELAIKELSKAIELLANDAENLSKTYAYLAECYLELGDKEKAREDFKKAGYATDEEISDYYNQYVNYDKAFKFNPLR